MDYYCSQCQRPIQGNSRLCVYCFFRAHRPCPHCMRRRRDGTWHPRRDRGSGTDIDCDYCQNERYVLALEE